jgi:hypothetical protein
MLAALGFFHAAPDGHFGFGTTIAVKAWQRSLGLTPDGVVQPGDVVFVPSLPTRVALDAKVIHRGGTVTGGEPVVEGLPAAPVFTVPVSDAQAALMPTGTRVQITTDQAEWEGYVADQRTDPQEGTTIILAGKDGASICGQDCGSIPVTGRSLLLSKVVTVESVSGLVVPSAALLSSADGTVSVTDTKGASHKVTVTTSAHGMSVIVGVPAGTRVRVPATGEK